MRQETAVIKHLATKVTDLDYRPSPEQRSAGELLQYMAVMALSPSINLMTGNWDHAEGLAAESANVTPENFDAAMDRQMARIEEVLSDVDESTATTAPATMPWGTPTTLAAAMMDLVLKCFAVYRMQLFLYAKAGDPSLSSANCWIGIDRP